MRITIVISNVHMRCIWKGADMAYKIIITKAEKKPSNKCWSCTPNELYEGRLYEVEETDEGL